MKLYKLFFLGLVFLSGCAPSLYEQNPGYYSYIVGNVKTGRIKKQLYPDVFTTPASCQKVITALLAYKDLGVDYRYETRLYQAGNDLIISFSGDPTLTSDDLLMLLKNHPIKGKIILDLSAFKTPELSKNLMLDDIGIWFCSPVSAANIDKNIFDIHIDEKGHVSTSIKYPISSDIALNGEKNSFSIRWEVYKGQPRLHVYGKLCGTCDFRITPPDIDSFLIKKMKSLFHKPVVIVRHEVKRNKKLIGAHFSKPLKDFVPGEFKLSDNFTFDVLYLTLLHKYCFNPQDWNAGIDVMKKLLEKHFQLKSDYLKLVDGSGLSRYSRIQPRLLFEILCKAKGIKEFEDCLIVSGDPNSNLKNRTDLPKDARVKSGTLGGIQNLCGYYKDDAFVIMASGFCNSTLELQKKVIAN